MGTRDTGVGRTLQPYTLNDMLSLPGALELTAKRIEARSVARKAIEEVQSWKLHGAKQNRKGQEIDRN